MSVDLEVQAFAGCEVSGDGQTISFNVARPDGESVRIKLSPDQAGSLAMTLPKLLSASLKAKFSDPSIRFVFPLGACNLEETPGRKELILSLSTPDGFEVCFCISPETLRDLAEQTLQCTPQHLH